MFPYKKVIFSKVGFYLLLVIIIVVFGFPIFWLVSMSFKTRTVAFSMPPQWFFRPTLENYQTVFGGELNFIEFYWNSIVVGLLSMVVSLTVGVLSLIHI